MDRVALLQQLLAEDPDDSFTLFALGFECQKRDRPKDALGWYERVRASSPDYTGVYYHIGKLYLQLGQFKEAEQAFRDGIDACNRTRAAQDLSELRQALMELEDGLS